MPQLHSLLSLLVFALHSTAAHMGFATAPRPHVGAPPPAPPLAPPPAPPAPPAPPSGFGGLRSNFFSSIPAMRWQPLAVATADEASTSTAAATNDGRSMWRAAYSRDRRLDKD